MNEIEVVALAEKGLFAIQQVPSPDAPFVVLAHGITVDHTEGRTDERPGLFDGLVEKLARHGLATLRFDFRGHGKSDGVDGFVSIDSAVADMRTVVAYIESVGVLGGMAGCSFGACATAVVANELPDSPATIVFFYPVLEVFATLFDPATEWARKTLGPESVSSLESGGTKLIDGVFPIGQPFLDSARKWDIAAQVRKLTQPTMFIHGALDTYVPWKTTRDTANEMSNASFVTLDCDHGFDEPGDARFVTETAAAFLRHGIA